MERISKVSVKDLIKMDAPEKRVHRAVQVEATRLHFPNPEKEKGLLITLGGIYTDKQGKLVRGSEVWYLVEVLGWNPKNILNVYINREAKAVNDANKDPRCKGIRNVYMPLSYKQEEGNACPVGWGEMGGVERVVNNLVNKGEKVSVVLLDLMGIVRTCLPTLIGITTDLRNQKGKFLILGNYNALERRNKNGEAKGKYNASEEMWSSTVTGRNGLTFKQCAHGSVKEFTLNLNANDAADGGKQFAYTGGHAPMQTVFLIGKGGKPLKVKAVKTEKVKTVKRTEKDPKWIAAGKKAYATRLANLKKNA